MKNSRRMLIAVVCLTVALCVTAATPAPQDPIKVAAGNFKVLFENDRVRVLDFHGKPGEKIPMHSHPAYVSYLVSGSGTTTFTAPDGKKTELTSKAGTATWNDAQTHSSEASVAVHSVLFELKK
jgi:quercetin dioxygenase-like cupin family protein